MRFVNVTVICFVQAGICPAIFQALQVLETGRVLTGSFFLAAEETGSWCADILAPLKGSPAGLLRFACLYRARSWNLTAVKGFCRGYQYQLDWSSMPAALLLAQAALRETWAEASTTARSLEQMCKAQAAGLWPSSQITPVTTCMSLGACMSILAHPTGVTGTLYKRDTSPRKTCKA